MADSEDLYMLLNVGRTADAEEVRRAYLRLALCLHPDKAAARHAIAQQQQEEQSDGLVLDAATRQSSVRRVRRAADEQFVRVERAYRVLCDPVRRLVYDEYGFEGLEAFEGSEMSKRSLGMPLKHTAEVRHLLDRLLREAAQNRQDVALATFGGMTADCTSLPLIDSEGRLVKRNLLPELTRLTVRQSVQVPLADATNVTFGGYSLHHSGMGTGSVYLSAHHEVSPSQWLGSIVQLGNQPKVGFSCGTISKGGEGLSVQTECAYEPDSGLGFRLSTTERLDPATVVDASWGVVAGEESGPAEDAATVHVTRLVGDGTGKISGEVALGNRSWTDLGLRLSYRRTLSPSRAVQVGGKVGVRGMELEMDSRRFLPRHVKIRTALRLSDRGVSAVFSLQRGAMVFELPVLLSTLFTSWTLTFGGLIPALADACVGWLMSSVWRRRAERQRLEEEPMNRRRLAKAWADAANQTRLMAYMADKKRLQETESGGIVILLARYGAELSQDCGQRWWDRAVSSASGAAAAAAPGNGTGGGTTPLSALVASEGPEAAAAVELVSQPNVDVTVPLQFFVQNSTLTLPLGSKSHLLGFFTPAACRPQLSSSTESSLEFPGGGGRGPYRQAREDWGVGGNEPLPAPAQPQLYVRYQFAGRTFEETFHDTQEVYLPSPTSTYQGDADVR
ncbi:unnamed protein product [Scytosiphon promiscuus]